MKKILLFLGTPYFMNGKSGVGTYQANIIRGLRCNYDIVIPDYIKSWKLPDNARPYVISRFKYNLISIFKFFLPAAFFFKQYDIIITDSCCFKKTKKIKQYTIVHDLLVRSDPLNFTFLQKMYGRIAEHTFKFADCLIAVSQNTKQSLHDLLHIDFNKIKVLPNTAAFFIEHKRFDNFIFIGDMRRNKNLSNLILGYNKYRNEYGGKEKLIIAGRKKYEFDNLEKLVAKLKLSDYVFFPGYISESNKMELFENAKALVFLSNNEGFGIPLVEAAVNKIPVICSDIPIFNSILDTSSAIFVNNKSISEIAKGFYDINNINISDDFVFKIKQKYSVSKFYEEINHLIN